MVQDKFELYTQCKHFLIHFIIYLAYPGLLLGVLELIRIKIVTNKIPRKRFCSEMCNKIVFSKSEQFVIYG